MNHITNQTTDDGYTKSIPIRNGEITAYIKNKNEQLGYYFEKKTTVKEGVETENMLFHILNMQLPIRENNLDNILNILAQKYQ